MEQDDTFIDLAMAYELPVNEDIAEDTDDLDVEGPAFRLHLPIITALAPPPPPP